MLKRCLYTYPAHGKVYICADGPEILVYSSNNDGPLWKVFGRDIVCGVGVTKEEVLVLESTGRLVRYRITNGELLEDELLQIAPTGLLVAADEVVAVIGEQNLYVRAPEGEPMLVGISGDSAVSFGPNGGAIGLGTSDGAFYAVDTSTGGAWGSVTFDGPVTSVAWCAQQEWLVSVGHHIHRVSGDGAQVLGTVDVQGMIDAVSCSLDGAIVATVTNGTHIRIFEWMNYTAVGNIWFQRQVQAIEFGPSSWLLIGHEDGDGNRVDLYTGQMTRTQAHEGRAQNAWPMQVDVNSAVLRGVSTSLKAGGAPIAVHVRSQSNEERRASSLKWVVLVIAILFVLCSSLGAIFCGLGPLIRSPKYYFGF